MGGSTANRVGSTDMPRQVFDYDPPDRFVAGTVGEPGQRTFFLQARGGGRVTSVALEKQQVAVLAERVDELLDEVLRRQRRQGAGAGGRAGRTPRTTTRWTRRSRRSSGSAR